MSTSHNEVSTGPSLQQILGDAQLPALPQSAIRLLELSQDESNGPGEYAMPIEADPGLMSQVLKFVNSSYFGFSREIASVKLAITLVGVRTIKNFALWTAVFSLMPNPKCGPFNLTSLWQDSLRRALFSRIIARLMGMKDPEEPFAAALLQDMAVPMLAKELPEEYLEMLESRNDGDTRLSDLERERFGWTHAEAGAEMAQTWKLPEALVTLVAAHVKLDELLADPDRDLGSTAVALSSYLPTTGDASWAEQEAFEAAYGSLVPEGSPSPSELFAQVDEAFTEFAPVLQISTPSKTLADFYG